MISNEQAAIAKGLLARGDKQHDIAAFLGVNPGRIAEIKTGKTFASIDAAPRRQLPTPADMTGGHGLWMAEQALRRARLGIDAALAFIQEQKGLSGG